MSECMLSIIIPHYNIPDLLSKLLNSIPVRDDIQIVVVDDNSTEKQEELKAVIENNSHRNLEFYSNYTGKNSAGTCRNIGLEHAKGKWIMFADSDDYYVDGWFEKVNKYFDTDYDIVFFMPTSIILNTEIKGERHKMYSDKVEAYLDNPSYENELRLRYAFAAPWSKLYKCSHIMDNNLKFQAVRTSDDVIFSMLCGNKAKKITCCKDSIYITTCRDGSLTTVVSEPFYDTTQRVRIEEYTFLFDNLTSDDLHTLNLDYMPLFLVFDTVAGGHGVKNAIEYCRILKENNVPLVNKKYANIVTMAKRFCKSIHRRIREN